MVGAGFDPTSGVVGAAYQSPQGWVFNTYNGDLWHAIRDFSWEGQPEQRELKEGDVVVRPPFLSAGCCG